MFADERECSCVCMLIFLSIQNRISRSSKLLTGSRNNQMNKYIGKNMKRWHMKSDKKFVRFKSRAVIIFFMIDNLLQDWTVNCGHQNSNPEPSVKNVGRSFIIIY